MHTCMGLRMKMRIVGEQREAVITMVATVAVVNIVLQGSMMAAAATTQHIVGDSIGWTIPSNASIYSGWSSSQNFVVGDTLVFNFTTGVHNVMQVPKSGYDGCSTQGTVGATLTTGPATVTLKSPGAHYYICGVATHCSLGQKLAVTVSAAGAPAAPPSSPSPNSPNSPSEPSSSAPGSAPGPGEPAPASQSSPGAAPPHGSSSAAPPSGSSSAAVCLLALLAAAAAAAAAAVQH